MKQSELIQQISNKTEISTEIVENIINELKITIIEELSAGNDVRLIGLGSFKMQDCKKRSFNTPQGIKVKSAVSKTPKFKPTRKFRESLKETDARK